MGHASRLSLILKFRPEIEDLKMETGGTPVLRRKPNRPLQTFVVPVKPALNQIANHRNQFIEARALRGHLRFVAGRDEHIVVTLNLENELFFHGPSLAHTMDFDKATPSKTKAPSHNETRKCRRHSALAVLAH